MSTVSENISKLWKKVKEFLQRFNLFPSIPPSTDPHQLKNQIISTRLFIVLLIFSLTIFIEYRSLVTITKSVTVESPSGAKYSELYVKYSTTLACPCTKISIGYDKILYINYTLHEVCSSYFISHEWIQNFAPERYPTLATNDFRYISRYAFQGLKRFCDLAAETISINLIQYYSTQFVSSSVTPYDVFQSQIQTFTDQFTWSSKEKLIESLSMIRSTTQSNALLVIDQSNYYLFLSRPEDGILPIPQYYGFCACDLEATCNARTAIYEYPTLSRVFTVPGFYTGCYPIEALLQSTLQCFYDESCIQQIQMYLPISSSIRIQPLNSSLLINYVDDSPINDIIENLMIEQWNLSVMHESYYDECAPAKCMYSYETRNDIVYIVTTIFGLVGGLVTVLKFLIPIVVMFVRRKRTVENRQIGKERLKNIFS